MTVKALPNIITVSRIFLSLSLLPFPIRDPAFLVLFLFCGFTDVADGFLARKLKAESTFGAKLDSYADFVMYLVLIYKYIFSLEIPLGITGWILVIIILRVLPAFINYFKYGIFATIHTLGNKLSGLLVFFFPIAYYFIGRNEIMVFICFVCTVSAVEEIIICCKSKELNLDQKSIFKK